MNMPPHNLPVEPSTVAEPKPHSKLLTVREVADELSVSPDSIYRLLDARRMPFHRIGGSKRIRRTDLDAFLAQVREAAANDSHYAT